MEPGGSTIGDLLKETLLKGTSGRNVTQPTLEDRPMVNYISGLVFVVLLLVGAVWILPLSQRVPDFAFMVGFVWVLSDVIIA